MNLYTYVNNNPLRWIDPLGFDAKKSWADSVSDFFDDLVDDALEEGACDGSVGGTLACAGLALIEGANKAFLEDPLNVAEDLANGEIDLDTAIDLGLAVCKFCKLGDKLKDIKDTSKKLKQCSFQAGTTVLTSDGYKPIEEVKVGDWVWSKNENNQGQWLWRPVTDTYSHLHDDGIELIVENADGSTSIITTTSEHSFYSDNQWLRADRLEVGMLLTTTDGELIIANNTALLSPLRAYNMTVGDTHTYTVGVEQFWVHNECDINKLNHIFGKTEHQLDDLVHKFGSQEKAFIAIQEATQIAIKNEGIKGVFETVIKVGGEFVTVRGNVVDGVVKIGTAFK